MNFLTVTVPPKFWADHEARSDETAGEVVRRSARALVVQLTQAQWEDLLADALHYASLGSGVYGFAGERGLVASAQATVRRLGSNPSEPRVS